ncbi:lycopene cyclase domain-containing protein [soil metagenome]
MAGAVAVVAVTALELRWRTGLFRSPSYWLTMAISLSFMVLVNGWLTKLSAPIVLYDADFRVLPRVPWDIPAEDYLFGVAMLNLVLLGWKRQDEPEAERDERAEAGR